MRFEDRIFRGGEQQLDGHEFSGCRFEGVQLVYSGSGAVSLSGCGFVDCAFEFRGAAANTLTLLRGMANPASGMQDMVVATFPELFQIKADFK